MHNKSIIRFFFSRSYEDQNEKMDEDENEKRDSKKSDNEDDEEAANILDAEPIIDRGCMSAIKLAANKGYISEDTKGSKSAHSTVASSKPSSIQAANYTIEERTYYDIDDKYNRSKDRYTSGPLVDFEEKRGYKPDVKLEYYDEKGRSMNEKEAFR